MDEKLLSRIVDVIKEVCRIEEKKQAIKIEEQTAKKESEETKQFMEERFKSLEMAIESLNRRMALVIEALVDKGVK